MEATGFDAAKRSALPYILIAGVVQGWALFALHHAVKYEHWPATQPAWFFALLSVAVVAPLTLELLASSANARITWLLLGALSAAFFYFGWHQGGAVNGSILGEHGRFEASPPYGIVAAVLWLLVLPFLHCRIASGRWSFPYAQLFDSAWRNQLKLAEALLFTGLFWILLGIWQELFHLLKIDYFHDLFSEPIFIYPVTALVFGFALHLIGSIDRVTTLVLEQLLNVLKWLAPLAALIMALFSAALLPRLPGMLSNEQRIIGATWLLWLAAFIVLFWNAAFRDGTVQQPFPRLLAAALRYATPLLLIVTVTALYALIVRARAYGLTVDRVWALIVAAATVLYAAGYAFAAFRPGAWLAWMARANVIVALALIVTIAAALTPLLSPYRLAASSQFAQAQLPHKGSIQPTSDEWRSARNSPFHYLRWDAGEYGLRRLRELAALPESARFSRIRKLAQAALASKIPWEQVQAPDIDAVLSKMRIFPRGRLLEPSLRTRLAEHMKESHNALDPNDPASRSAGLYVDLDGDGQEEFVLFQQGFAMMFRNRGSWESVSFTGDVVVTECDWKALFDRLERADYSSRLPHWKILSVGPFEFQAHETDSHENHQCAPAVGTVSNELY